MANEKEEKKLNLLQKILKIMEIAGVLQRTKEGFGYKYVPEEDIQAKVTAGQSKYGVLLTSSVVPGTTHITPVNYTKVDKSGKTKTINEVIVQADMMYTWYDVDTGDKLEVPWTLVGQMEDAAQAFGAGATYCNRYFLMKTLQLATTESDPDNYRSKQLAAESEENKKKEMAEAKEVGAIVDKIVITGTSLMQAGLSKTELVAIISKFNDGNGNPKAIHTVNTANKILVELENLSSKFANKENTKGNEEKVDA